MGEAYYVSLLHDSLSKTGRGNRSKTGPRTGRENAGKRGENGENGTDEFIWEKTGQPEPRDKPR
jgi:hypothetical protein